jgi:hypothetical protein
MTKYLRIKSGEASFQLVERFDEVEKAADPNAQGEVVECKVENIKLDFTKVTKEKDGRVKELAFRSTGIFNRRNTRSSWKPRESK